MRLYWWLPVVLQETGLSFYARKLDRLYYNSEFDEYKKWLLCWKSWPSGYIDEWQSERLRHILKTAAEQVPYYRKKLKDIDWTSIKSPGDLGVIPLLEKQSVRQNEEAFLVDNIQHSSLWIEKTSGTTGTYLKIYWPKLMVPQWWANTEVLVRNIAGVGQEIPRAMIGGRPIVPGATNNPPYWRLNRYWNQLYLSSYHISRKTAPDYVAALKKHGSQWITGYGSAISALAESALSEGIEKYQMKSVIVSGDTLQAGMRKSIESYFQCKCYDHYGQCEGVAMAMECTHGKMHVLPTIGIIEILRDDASPCEKGEVGEIVATSLLNDAMPLIRYRVGDSAAWAQDQSCPCGNKHAVIEKLEGRTDDYLITEDGRKVGRLAAFKQSPSVHSAQFVQDYLGHACLLVRPGDGYEPSHSRAIRENIIDRIGKFDIDIVEVDEIPKTPQGKTALVIRLMERPELKESYKKIIND